MGKSVLAMRESEGENPRERIGGTASREGGWWGILSQPWEFEGGNLREGIRGRKCDLLEFIKYVKFPERFDPDHLSPSTRFLTVG